jgi:hypothetical protein
MSEIRKPKDKKVLEYWIMESMDARGVTDWERNFIRSISKQLTDKGSLSPKQEDTLERIYAERTR